MGDSLTCKLQLCCSRVNVAILVKVDGGFPVGTFGNMGGGSLSQSLLKWMGDSLNSGARRDIMGLVVAILVKVDGGFPVIKNRCVNCGRKSQSLLKWMGDSLLTTHFLVNCEQCRNPC